MAEIKLTEGAIKDLMDGKQVKKPIFQILAHKYIINATNGEVRYRLQISDGCHSHTFAMLATPLNKLINENIVSPFCIIRADRYVSNASSVQPRLIVITELTLLQSGTEINSRIGTPVAWAISTDGIKKTEQTTTVSSTAQEPKQIAPSSSTVSMTTKIEEAKPGPNRTKFKSIFETIQFLQPTVNPGLKRPAPLPVPISVPTAVKTEHQTGTTKTHKRKKRTGKRNMHTGDDTSDEDNHVEYDESGNANKKSFKKHEVKIAEPRTTGRRAAAVKAMSKFKYESEDEEDNGTDEYQRKKTIALRDTLGQSYEIDSNVVKVSRKNKQKTTKTKRKLRHTKDDQIDEDESVNESYNEQKAKDTVNKKRFHRAPAVKTMAKLEYNPEDNTRGSSVAKVSKKKNRKATKSQLNQPCQRKEKGADDESEELEFGDTLSDDERNDKDYQFDFNTTDDEESDSNYNETEYFKQMPSRKRSMESLAVKEATNDSAKYNARTKKYTKSTTQTSSTRMVTKKTAGRVVKKKHSIKKSSIKASKSQFTNNSEDTSKTTQLKKKKSLHDKATKNTDELYDHDTDENSEVDEVTQDTEYDEELSDGEDENPPRVTPINYLDNEWYYSTSKECQMCGEEFKSCREASNCITENHKRLRCYVCFTFWRNTKTLYEHYTNDHCEPTAKEIGIRCHICTELLPFDEVSFHMLQYHIATHEEPDDETYSDE